MSGSGSGVSVVVGVVGATVVSGLMTVVAGGGAAVVGSAVGGEVGAGAAGTVVVADDPGLRHAQGRLQATDGGHGGGRVDAVDRPRVQHEIGEGLLQAGGRI